MEEQTLYIDPTNDAAFQSLRRLLSAPSTSTQHLSLLSQATLYGSITFYLSELELSHVAEFVGVVNSSGCLWTPPAALVSSSAPAESCIAQIREESKVSWTNEPQNVKQLAASQSLSFKPSDDRAASPSAFLIARSNAISQAVATAMARRTDSIAKSRRASTGWGTRNALSDYIQAMLNGMSAVEAADTPESYKATRGLPISKFAILTGMLNGLYVLKDQHKKRRDMSILEEMAALRTNPALALNIQRHLNVVEDEWIVTLAEILDTLQGPRLGFVQTKTEDPTGMDTSSDQAGKMNEWEVEFRKRAAEVPGSASAIARSRRARRNALQEISDVPLYIAAQLAPFVPDRKLQALDPVQLATVTSNALLSLFEGKDRKGFLASLSADVSRSTDGKVSLKADSTTFDALQNISSATLFPLIGPLSRLLSRALAKAVTSLTPDELSSFLLGTADHNMTDEGELFPILVRMSRLASNLEHSWLASSLAVLGDDQVDERSKKDTTQMWAIFKTVLFSYTMVFDSLINAIVEMCPSPTLIIPPVVIGETDGLVNPSRRDRKWPSVSTSNLPPPYLQIVQTTLSTFSHLYWITSTFGSDGFDVYRKVFYSSLDVLGRDGEACIQLLELIAPEQVEGTNLLELNAAKRSRTTYFLNVVEQLVAVLPNEVIEQMILPICRPYLEDTRFQDTFESAHSVILALYRNKKRCTLELGPFYVNLLITSFPGLLNSTQFEYAYTTIVSALSDQSDSISWWTVGRLAQEIKRERTLQHTTRISAQQGGYGESMVNKREMNEARTTTHSHHPSKPDSMSIGATDVRADPQDRLMSLQKCYIALIPFINLALLRSALKEVEGYILEHRRIEDDVKYGQAGPARRVELCRKAYGAVQDLNTATREEGLRWWLDNRAQFGV